MKATETSLPGVYLIEPALVGDHRGFFMESYNRRRFEALTGFAGEFVQDNHSRSARGVLRGLHYQIRQPQGKLVRVIRGEIYDVAVDIRRSSSSFGRWFGTHLSAQNRRMLWVPPGYAHGFLTLADDCEVLYKVTDYWAPEHERFIRWDDPVIGIEWPVDAPPVLSAKDAAAPLLADAEVYE